MTVPGATVTATHGDSGTTVSRVTDPDGRFFLPGLRIGRWDLVAALDSFRPSRLTVDLEVGRSLSVDFTLGGTKVTDELFNNLSGGAPGEMQFGLRFTF